MASRGVNKVIITLYESGSSIPVISKIMNTSKSTIRLVIKEAGKMRTRQEALRLAGKQGKLSSKPNLGRKWSKETKNKMRNAKLGKGAGTSLKPNGYIEITMGENKGKGQHRILMEQHIGRKLNSSEVVHHIDKNRSNNKMNNLELMTRSEHAKHHALENNELRQRNELGRFL